MLFLVNYLNLHRALRWRFHSHIDRISPWLRICLKNRGRFDVAKYQIPLYIWMWVDIIVTLLLFILIQMVQCYLSASANKYPWYPYVDLLVEHTCTNLLF